MFPPKLEIERNILRSHRLSGIDVAAYLLQQADTIQPHGVHLLCIKIAAKPLPPARSVAHVLQHRDVVSCHPRPEHHLGHRYRYRLLEPAQRRRHQGAVEMFSAQLLDVLWCLSTEITELRARLSVGCVQDREQDALCVAGG